MRSISVMTFHDVPFYDTLICDGPLYDAANLQCLIYGAHSVVFLFVMPIHMKPAYKMPIFKKPLFEKPYLKKLLWDNIHNIKFAI